jgi:hypothetical protein
MDDIIITPDDGAYMHWIEDEYPEPPLRGLCLAIALMGAFMMGAHDAQVHMVNQARREAQVRASLPPDWRVS